MLVINGNFLTEPLMGVQRYAFEILKRVHEDWDGEELVLAVPGILPADSSVTGLHLSGNLTDAKMAADRVEAVIASMFPKFRVERFGDCNGKRWEQFELGPFLRKHRAKGIHLCNTVPVLHPEGLVVVHDISFKTHPEFFTQKGDWHEILFRRLMYSRVFKKAEQVLTISQAAKDEILSCYRPKCSDIRIAGDGWEHFKEIKEDESALEKFGLASGSYYYCLASLAKNKNLHWIIDNARKYPENRYCLSGRPLGESFENLPANVIFTGFVTDGEAACLMRHSKAFLFPSTYEGFGIPPMEALSRGAKVILSDIPVLREIYGQSVVYCNPKDSDVNLNQLSEQNVRPASEVLDAHTWEQSAKVVADAMKQLS